ncbi:conserved Plasmodium protein, unknown function [Plasmodium gallinaceum]|uniref:Uncharacterized protein n=1 Tax=Plasmodium gallinaceum TaxID=5849 RepID=A0A1J1GWZ9_PLAGA|nr:conserved Plasmodium protein, unknown function [Plasmodium gallinaceum]CRG96838.1 conserved Plasmodium protein, unknown function [Plasmodium gallinaceum]
MGNFIGFKEKNKNIENINIFEKRYGYNLNDLHSYIYKINLPLKPPYINYVLQEKNRKTENFTKEHLNNEEEKKLNNTSDPVDLYKNYERENINNSNNIYSNKLIINNKEPNEKYDDKYVHISYDNNYEYDLNKNNIYTEDNISDYILQHTNTFSNKNKINKTYVNLCLNYYNNLNTCIIKKYEKNVQNKKYKFTRLHTCKPHYVLFSRCIKYRDKKLMKEIKKIELNYFNSLNSTNKLSYLNEFLTNLNYHEYVISKLYDGVEKIKINKELNELKERYNNILKHSESNGEKLPNINEQKRKTNSNKKHILLNI